MVGIRPKTRHGSGDLRLNLRFGHLSCPTLPKHYLGCHANVSMRVFGCALLLLLFWWLWTLGFLRRLFSLTALD